MREDTRKMHCISRIDNNDKNLFLPKNNPKRRWNVYSQIAIENNSLHCAKETYDLTKICFNNLDSRSQPCTLLNSNEVVDIGFDYYM